MTITSPQASLIRHWWNETREGRSIELPETLSNRAALVRRIEQIRRGNPQLFHV